MAGKLGPGGKALVREKATLLEVEGVKQGPAEVNLDQVQMVIDINQPLVAAPNSGQGLAMVGSADYIPPDDDEFEVWIIGTIPS